MKSEIIITILAIIMIISAFFVFDYNSFNKICASAVLLLNGVNALILAGDSDKFRFLSKWLVRVMYLVIILLIIKLLFWGFNSSVR